MIRVVENKTTEMQKRIIVEIVDGEDVATEIEEEVTLFTIVETFEDIDVVSTDDDGIETTSIESTRLELKRVMVNGDQYIITESDNLIIEQYIPFEVK